MSIRNRRKLVRRVLLNKLAAPCATEYWVERVIAEYQELRAKWCYSHGDAVRETVRLARSWPVHVITSASAESWDHGR